MEESLILNTLMAETSWSHSSHSKAQTTGHLDRFRLPDVRYRNRSARSVNSTNKDASCRGAATTINTHF